MSEYVPSDEDVREVWGAWSGYGGLVTRPGGDTDWDGRYAEFDAWLARVRAQAWDKGCEAFEVAHKCDHIEPWAHLRDNPYRPEQNHV